MNLNYNGDVTDVVGRVAGPDDHGALYEATAAVYDVDNDKSYVDWKPISPSDERSMIRDSFGFYWIVND